MKPVLIASSNPVKVAAIKGYPCPYCKGTGALITMIGRKMKEEECYHCQPVRDINENYEQEVNDAARELNELDTNI